MFKLIPNRSLISAQKIYFLKSLPYGHYIQDMKNINSISNLFNAASELTAATNNVRLTMSRIR